MVNASPFLVWSFVTLAIVIALAFVVAVYRSAVANGRSHSQTRNTTVGAATATTAWLGLTFALALMGRLSFSSRPPTMLILIVVIIAIAIGLGASRLGRQLATGIPLAVLVGAQGFRFPLELLLHRSYNEGLMPVQMSFSGFNFDILTGISAMVVSAIVVWRPRSLTIVRIWNTAGVVLLANILTIAMLSAPTPFRAFHNEPANTWVTHAPWVWLPSVFVLAAILGHILIYRRLRAEMNTRASESAASRTRP